MTARVRYPRTITCVHCHGSRRDVGLWAQIIDLGRPVVCCRLDERIIPTPTPKRGTAR